MNKYHEKPKRTFLAFLAACLLGMPLLTGCPMLGISGLVIRQINIEKPTLNVGERTEILVDAQTLPFRNIRYTIECQRGRVEKVKGTDNRFYYYAPWTSRAPNAQGNLQEGDTLLVRVEDGWESKSQNEAVNLTGSTILLVQGGDNTKSHPENGQIMIGAVDSSGSMINNLRKLTDVMKNPIKGTSPVLSPDGRRIAYVYYPGTGSQIMTVDVMGTVMNLTGNATGFNLDPTWDPSSHEVAFVSDRGGNFDLYRINAIQQGNLPVQITRTACQERHPAWNPHMAKRSIIAVSANVTDMNSINTPGSPENVWNVFLIDIPNGRYDRQMTRLTMSGHFAVEPSWKIDDGEYLAYTYYGPMYNNVSNSTPYQRIFTIRYTENGTGVPLNPGETSPAVKESNALWSPAGDSELVYLRMVDSGQLGGGYGELWRQTYTSGVAERPPLQWNAGTNVPMVWRRSTQNELVGCRPVDWR